MQRAFLQLHRALLLLAASAALLVSLPLCAQTTAPAPTQTTFHEVTDEFGRTIRLPLVPARIVSLAPSLTETLYALGVQDRLVGVTDFCDYPADAQKKTKVGGMLNPNLEQIAALHPDLVLATKEINRLDTVRALDTLGIPTYAADANTHTVEEILSSTRRLADLLGVSGAGNALSAELQGRLAALHNKLENVPATRVLFVVWTEPLISVGQNTFVADALRKSDATSIVESKQDWPQISLEEVVKLQPDYLVFAASHSESGTRDFESLSNLPGWRLLDAVRNHHFAVISDAVNRPAPRIVSAIEDLAHQLHPAAFVEQGAPEKQLPKTPDLSKGSIAQSAASTQIVSQECPCAR